MKYEAEFDLFVDGVAARLEKGARDYGGRSFEGPPLSTLGEIQEELLDVCGWSFVLWLRLERIRAALKEEENESVSQNKNGSAGL